MTQSPQSSTATDQSLDPNSPLREMGPIDYLIIEFPHRRFASGNGFSILLDLVNNGTIRILDLAFIRKEQDGTIVRLMPSDLAQEGQPEIMVFDGAASGLLDEGDLADIGGILDPDTTAAALVYENSWAAPFAIELRKNGAQLIANGRIPVQSLVAALDEADAGGSTN